MPHQFIQTEDGSTTLYVPELNEHYHSVHGAIQESRHIFIRAGIDFYRQTYPERSGSGKDSLHILEAGFGTGLNAFLTMQYAHGQLCPIFFHSIEKYPLSSGETDRLNYPGLLPAPVTISFRELHQSPWNEEIRLTPFFRLYKQEADFRDINFSATFDIVFFDAFNPDVQPHLWTAEVFERFYKALKPGGILVTYCVKGIVKQALRQVGFTLKRLPGPPGKREMLRATKPE